MNSTITIITAMFSFLIMETTIFSQTKELFFPKNSAVSGISFYTYDKGIITTQDTTIYQVTVDENNNPNICELISTDLFNESTTVMNFHHPFWINDSTFGFVKTFYYHGAFDSWHSVVVSYDNGNSFHSIYVIDDHFAIQKIIVQNDSLLYIGVTSDIYNSIEILKYVHNKDSTDHKYSYFVDNVYPEFTVLDDDRILISTGTDSLCTYDFAEDSLLTFATNLQIGQDYGLFYKLTTGENGELFGRRSEGIYRSVNNGNNWTLVLQGENFRSVRQEAPGRWWVMQLNSNDNRIWRSIDNGLTWSPLFSVGTSFGVFEAVHPNWYWIGSEFSRGKILYGLYEKLSVPILKNEYNKQFILSQNYPNPFNSATTIEYHLNIPGFVQIDIYNIHGQFIRNIIEREQSMGWQKIKWDGKDQIGGQVTSGIYFIECCFTKKFVTTDKMLLLR
jgi:hypothetical protein